MPTANERQSNELAEISSAEMARIQGGATMAEYALLLCAVGEPAASASVDGYSDWRTNFGRTC